MRPNLAYLSVAYRKAIIAEVIALLTRRYLPDDSGDAPAILVCEEVLHRDARVPREAFCDFVAELQEEQSTAESELRKFEIVGRHERKHESAPTQSAESGNKAFQRDRHRGATPKSR
jgi:hypothetical protein